MPYIGGDVSVFFDEAARVITADAARDMTNGVGRELERVVRMNTPVRTGRLRLSWRRTPAHPDGHRWKTEVSTDVEYAPDVENGTGLWGPKHAKYLIKPKKPGGVLRFEVNGRVVFARYVWHPGSPGNHMMAIGLNIIDSLPDSDAVYRLVLDEWVRRVEANGERQR